MTDDELLKITDSMQQKLGADTSALIADDIGMLITGNATAIKTLRERDDQIARLTAEKEKLVLANGNLLKQIPVESHNAPSPRRQEESDVERFSFKDAFDEHGNFIR